MTRFDAISIDLDDTLWPIAPVIERAERALHEWLMDNCPRIALNGAGHLGTIRKRILRRYPERTHDFAFLRKAGLQLLLEQAGYDVELVETAYRVFFEARNEVEVYADVIPALESLSERFVLLAVTNGNADLDRIGLAELFDHHVRAADVGAAKPDAEIFVAAARAAGVAPERVLHVGDAPLEDIDGAHRAGMQAVWLNRFGRSWPDEHEPPMAEIQGLHELHSLVV
ncbi:MAG: HAD family hydrolase, partial [Gammaproteobacteria bacterium]|nr:HAD family hydrolase [Gammaproteobacteria bacterium]